MEILQGFIHYFNQGGLVMYFLLLASIGAGAVIIDRWRYYRRRRAPLKAHWQKVKEMSAGKKPAEVAAYFAQRHTALDKMTAAGFRAQAGGRNVSLALEASAQLEAAKLKKGLPVLAMLVTLSPILGLMGTVIGMIQSFSVFNLQSGSPMAITGGVGEALIATVTGLMVATLALLGHSYFGLQLDSMVTDMEQLGSLLEDMFFTTRGQMVTERGKKQHEAA